MRRPRVKLDNLLAVLTVAEKHDINLAADEMGLSPSAVRKQIEGVEGALGVRLFAGKQRALNLTDKGATYHPEAVRSLEHALLGEEKVLARVKLENHHLVIGHSTYLPPTMLELIREIAIEDEPIVHIEHMSDLTTAIIRGVIEGRFHAGFGFLPIHSPELLARPLFGEPLVACIPSSFRLASKATIYPHDLDGEPIIAVSREPLPHLHQQIEDHFLEFGIKLNVLADAFAPPEAQTCVLQKIGTCLIAGSSVVRRPGITIRPLSTRALMRRSGVFIREDNRSPLIQKLVEAVVQRAVDARLRP